MAILGKHKQISIYLLCSISIVCGFVQKYWKIIIDFCFDFPFLFFIVTIENAFDTKRSSLYVCFSFELSFGLRSSPNKSRKISNNSHSTIDWEWANGRPTDRKLNEIEFWLHNNSRRDVHSRQPKQHHCAFRATILLSFDRSLSLRLSPFWFFAFLWENVQQ